jgi:catechol 2,3-dioxygenase-like lactoylglutathione lyase family enzyme
VLGRVDHVGVAVEDLDAALERYARDLALPVAHRETVEAQGVEAVLLDVGDGHVELLRPLDPSLGIVPVVHVGGPSRSYQRRARVRIPSRLFKGRTDGRLI